MTLDQLAVLVALAIVTTVQFYSGRRINLALMAYAASELERRLRPIDKEYRRIGLYGGFCAYYRVRGELVKEVEVILALTPRYSLFYLPISYLIFGPDRMTIIYRLKGKTQCEAYAIRPCLRMFRLMRKLVKSGFSEVESIKANNTKFRIFVRNCDSDMLKHLLSRVEGIQSLYYLAVLNDEIKILARFKNGIIPLLHL